MLIFHSLTFSHLAFPMPLDPSVSNLAASQPWLAGGEGETASELSCVSDGEPQSDPLHPVHTLLGLCELHLQGNHFLSHTYAPGHWVIWAQIAFGSSVRSWHWRGAVAPSELRDGYARGAGREGEICMVENEETETRDTHIR